MVIQQQDEPLTMTEAEYLEFESSSEVKHEYVNGKVYAMTDFSWNHVIINGNTTTTLGTQLADTPYYVLGSRMRYKVKPNSFRYPDATVICDEPQFYNKRDDTVMNPTVIVEILSPSTALIDCSVKLDEYTQIDSLQAYILIAQHEAKVEVYTRQNAEKWTYQIARGLDAKIDLPPIGCVLELSNIYKKVDLKSDETD